MKPTFMFYLSICAFLFLASSDQSLKTISTPAPSRSIASVPGVLSKEDTLRQGVTSLAQRIGKPSGLLNVLISAPGKNAVDVGSVIQLEARIEAQADLRGAKFVWLLPSDGVTAIGGPVEGTIGDLANGEAATLALSIRSDTVENRLVHLHVFKVVDGELMGQMAQYNTVDQERLEQNLLDKAQVLSEQEPLGIAQKMMQ